MPRRNELFGLRRGTVVVVPYASTWQRLFAKEKRRLRAEPAFRSAVIEHIGGTSITGMVSKPIIDIAIGAADALALVELADGLVAVGYKDRGMFGRYGGVHLFQRAGANGAITHHVHLMQQADPNWTRYIAYRDCLRSNATLRTELIDMKRTLANKYAADRVAYTAGKAAFVDRVHTLLGLAEEFPTSAGRRLPVTST